MEPCTRVLNVEVTSLLYRDKYVKDNTDVQVVD